MCDNAYNLLTYMHQNVHMTNPNDLIKNNKKKLSKSKNSKETQTDDETDLDIIDE